MLDASEDEHGDDLEFDDHGKSNEDAMKERAAREEALRKMMEDDDGKSGMNLDGSSLR